MIILHHLEYSQSFRILWLLEELKVEYGLEKYPDYTQASIVDFDTPSQRQNTDADVQLEKRGIKTNRKLLTETLEQLYSESKSQADFLDRMNHHEDMEVYQRGKSIGIISKQTGKRWRLKGLGFTDERIKLLETKHFNRESIMELRKNRGKDKIRSIYFDRDV